MIRVTDLMKNNSLIRNVNRHQYEMDKVQNQLATGKRIQSPSDDPSGAAAQMFFQTRVTELDQFENNITTAQSRLNHTDGELANVTDIMQRIRELSIQASNGIYQGDNGFELRKVIASEIDQHLRSLIEIANSMDATGKPLFGGHTVENPPFKVVTANIRDLKGLEIPDQIVGIEYNGDMGKRLHEVERDQYIDVNIPGNKAFWGTNMSLTGSVDTSGYSAQTDQSFRIDGTEIHVVAGDTIDDIIDKINNAGINVKANRIGQDYMSLHTESPHQIWLEDLQSGSVLQDLGLISNDNPNPPSNYASSATVTGESLFDVVIKLRNDLYQADQLEIGGRDIANIDSAMENILHQRATVGARQNRLENHIKRVSWDKTYMTELLAKTEGVDVPETIMNLKWLETVHQYALNVGSRIIRPTLMDFLR